jgi:hypothetical protein
MITAYKLATFRHQNKPTPVIEINRRYWPISTVAPDLLPPDSTRGLMQLFDDWEQGGFKSEAQQGVDEWKLRIRKRLQAYVRRPRMANEMHG